jgi:copper(I)-binding protein
MTVGLPRLLAVSCLLAACFAATADEPQTRAVAVRDAWARATAPGMTMGAVYLTVQGGTTPDRLVAATTRRAGATQLHVVTSDGDMARMRETTGVEIPAGATVALAPQGTHLMLMELSQPLVAGERFPLTLEFSQAGTLAVSVRVVAPGDEPGDAR